MIDLKKMVGVVISTALVFSALAANAEVVDGVDTAIPTAPYANFSVMSNNEYTEGIIQDGMKLNVNIINPTAAEVHTNVFVSSLDTAFELQNAKRLAEITLNAGETKSISCEIHLSDFGITQIDAAKLRVFLWEDNLAPITNDLLFTSAPSDLFASDKMVHAAKITLDTPVNGRIDDTADRDLFQIIPEVSGNMRIFFDEELLYSNFSNISARDDDDTSIYDFLTITIRDSDFEVLAENEPSIDVEEGKTYYVDITGINDIPYTFTLNIR